MNTKLKFNADFVRGAAATMRADFAASGAPGTFEANAVRVIAARLKRKPMQYLEFGPYWWAVKAVLVAADVDLGQRGDPLMASEYRGATDTDTLIVGEIFKELYRATYFVGNARFSLDDESDDWVLRDADMEERAAA